MQSATQPSVGGYAVGSSEMEVEESPVFRHAKLIVVTAANYSKFYEMKENVTGTFTAYFGRVGNRSSTAIYSMKQ